MNTKYSNIINKFCLGGVILTLLAKLLAIFNLFNSQPDGFKLTILVDEINSIFINYAIVGLVFVASALVVVGIGREDRIRLTPSLVILTSLPLGGVFSVILFFVYVMIIFFNRRWPAAKSFQTDSSAIV